MQTRILLTVVNSDGEIEYVYADEAEDVDSINVIDREIVHVPN